MMAEPVAYLTRKAVFSASHRLHSPHLSVQENIDVYGKCNNLHGHGHNYTVEVTVRGPVNPKNGMVMNIVDLNSIIDKVVMDQLDHKNLDKDVPYFTNVVSTTENLAVFIYDEMQEYISPPNKLYEVKIYETDKNSVVYRGERDVIS